MEKKYTAPKSGEFNTNTPLFLLDAGHGGLINGVYQTSGKRSPDWDKGVYYEGVGNRDFVERIMRKVEIHNTTADAGRKLQAIALVPEDKDVPLASKSRPTLDTRVKRANDVHKMYPNTVYVSIHSNAGGGTGWEVFTSKGQTKSDEIAELFTKAAEELLPEVKQRKDLGDGDSDKEQQFAVLRYTTCPAVLTENLFMDNKLDYDRLHDNDIRDRLAQAHFNAMLAYQNKLISA